MSIVTDTLNRLQAERARRVRRPQASAVPEHSEAFAQPPVPAPRPRVRRSVIMVLLGSVGIGVYFWGLPFVPNGHQAHSEHKTAKALNPVSQPQVVKVVPAPQPVVQTTREAPKLFSRQSASSQTASFKDFGKPDFRLVQTKPWARANHPSVVKVNTPSSRQQKKRVASIPGNATASEVKLARAQALIKKGGYAGAVTLLRPLFVTPPDIWEPWFWLGTAQLGLGQWEKARDSLAEGLARDATVPQLWVQRALVSQQQGRFGEALESLRQAELLAPKLPEVQLNLAYSLEVLGERQVSVDHYRRFLALTEGNHAYRVTRKKVLARLSRLENT